MHTNILITGGTGLVGLNLSNILKEYGFNVTHLSRKENLNAEFPAYAWDPSQNEIDEKALLEVDYIIHLAGAGIADKRWTSSRKVLIRESRTESARLILNSLKTSKKRLKGFISASGITYYGYDTGENWVDESSPHTEEYLSKVVVDWENAAREFETVADQVAMVRTGVVMDKKDGALPKLIQPIKFGAGAPIGSGNQYMSWIHIEDLSRMYLHIINNKLNGIYNGVAPNPVTNKELTKKAAKILGKPLFLPNVPGFALKLFFGELAEILLGGNRVSAKKIIETDFQFRFHLVEDALQDLLS